MPGLGLKSNKTLEDWNSMPGFQPKIVCFQEVCCHASDVQKHIPAWQECKKLLEQKRGKPGENPFNPAYLTAEEAI